MINNDLNNKQFKKNIIIIRFVLLSILFLWGLSILYNYFNVIPGNKIINDINKRFAKQEYSNIVIKGAKIIDNKKIIVLEYMDEDIENWGYIIYKEVRNNCFVYDEIYTNSFKTEIRMKVRTKTGIYNILCKLDGSINIIE